MTAADNRPPHCRPDSAECIDETIALYIGSPAVASALNVIPSLNWAVCGSNSSFNYIRTELDERIDVYPVVLAGGVKVLVYNGDADAVRGCQRVAGRAAVGVRSAQAAPPPAAPTALQYRLTPRLPPTPHPSFPAAVRPVH
jgi:hypothetical protein